MEISTVLSLSLAGVSVLFVIITFATNRKDKSSDKLDAMETSLLKLNMKSDQICATTNETRTDFKSMSKDIMNLDRRITAIERDVKTLFNDRGHEHD